MEYVLASRNRKKIEELETIIRGYTSYRCKFKILSLDDIGYEGDIKENGSTFE